MKKILYAPLFFSIFIFASMYGFISLSPHTAAAYTLDTTFCHTFNKNLQQGNSGTEVYALRQVLADQGLLSDDAVNTSMYDNSIAQAVSQFQEKYALSILSPQHLTKGTGTVGPSTRAKLNRIYACGVHDVTPAQPIFTPTRSTSAHTYAPPSITSVIASSPSYSTYNDLGLPTRADLQFSVTVQNNDDADLYINKDGNQSVGFVSNLDSLGARVTFINPLQSTSLSFNNAFYVNPHSSRTFTIQVVVNNVGNPDGKKAINVGISRMIYSSTTPDIANPASVYAGSSGSVSLQLGS